MPHQVNIEIEVDPTMPEDHQWTASLHTKEHGTFYGYGSSEQEAINDAETEMNYWLSRSE